MALDAYAVKKAAIKAVSDAVSAKFSALLVEWFECVFNSGTSGPQWIGHKDPSNKIKSVTFGRLCRAGVEAGEDGYLIIGRNYYMSPERHAEALKLLSERRVRKTQAPRQNVANELRDLLKCLKGGRR